MVLAGFRLLVVNGHAVVVESLPIGEQLGAMLALQKKRVLDAFEILLHTKV